MKASAILTKAANLVGGDRAAQHGPKRKNFENIATLWNAYLSIRPDPLAPIGAVDVGMMLADVKKARTQTGKFNTDDYTDLAGYAACAGEIAAEE